MRKAGLPPPGFQERAVQGGKQPGFHFCCVAQLVALVRPNCECLLGQITGVRLGARQAESELIKRRIKAIHQALKIQALSHDKSSILRGVRATSVPVESAPGCWWSGP